MTVGQQGVFIRGAAPAAPSFDLWVDIPARRYVLGEGLETRSVDLKAFRIGRYPITVADFARFRRGHGAHSRRATAR